MNLYAIPAATLDKLSVDAEREFAKGKLVLRTQTPSDRERIAAVCPLDQAKTFVGRWVNDGRDFIFEEAAPGEAAPEIDPEVVKLLAADEKDLKTLAAERSVEWDKKASRETMVDRIVAAGRKK